MVQTLDSTLREYVLVILIERLTESLRLKDPRQRIAEISSEKRALLELQLRSKVLPGIGGKIAPLVQGRGLKLPAPMLD